MLPSPLKRVPTAAVRCPCAVERPLSKLIRASERPCESAAAPRHSAFDNAYMQLEYSWRAEWTPYARLEGSHGAATDQFVALLPRFERQRVLAGMRYDFTAQQALKLEMSTLRIRDSRYAELQVQWSAVWP